MSINLSQLWDFNQPELSEERFRAALTHASPNDALILQTQIARTYGIRADFTRARQILSEIEPRVASASAKAQVYYHLELGRTYTSATHPLDTQTPEVKASARQEYLRAFELAKSAGIDRLAIDALHMMTFVETSGEQQVEWNQKALEYMYASSQPDAKKWEASLRNNLGYALHTTGRYQDALREFELALAARERAGEPGAIRIAWWMIAWTMRSMGRIDDALAIQLRLEKECADSGEPDQYVFEELEELYRAKGDWEKAGLYAARRKAAQ